MAPQIPVPAAAEASLQGTDSPGVYSGSGSCRQCHEKFYQLWAPSHHGLAMQPYTTDFAQAHLTPQGDPVKIGAFSYRAKLDKQKGFVLEQGPEGEKQYQILHVLGGKNVFYFLAPYERGRLQTLPVAYNVNTKQWFDTAGSGCVTFPAGNAMRPFTGPILSTPSIPPATVVM
jgi:hypothetical protein